jgi:hypothetical protein
MTEEECELVAAAIRRTRERYGDLDDLIRDLAGELQLADPGFDAVRFMAASGFREDGAPPTTLPKGSRRVMTCRSDLTNVIEGPLVPVGAEGS